MRNIDLIGISIKNLKSRWSLLPALGFAIGAFCLCFTGAILTSVHQEKAQPFELNVSAQGNASISDETIVKLSQIPGVLAATPLLDVPATVKTGNFTAQLTLTGIDGAYLGNFDQGQLFPKDSVMPYLVLNEAACRQFTDGKEDISSITEDATERPLPAIGWLNAVFSMQTGDGSRPVVSKVCGILAGSSKDQEPAAYVSLSVAKELIRTGGQSISPSTAKVRVKDIGVAKGVSDAVAALGLVVGDTNAEQQAKWDVEMEEMGYLLSTGIFSILCAMVLLSAWKRIWLLEQEKAWSMLLWLGIESRAIDRMFIFQAIAVSLLGAAIGIIVSICLPSFLPQELIDKSIFMKPVPASIVVSALVACILAGLIPMVFIEKSSVKKITYTRSSRVNIVE